MTAKLRMRAEMHNLFSAFVIGHNDQGNFTTLYHILFLTRLGEFPATRAQRLFDRDIIGNMTTIYNVILGLNV